jgi:hypothetical protein
MHGEYGWGQLLDGSNFKEYGVIILKWVLVWELYVIAGSGANVGGRRHKMGMEQKMRFPVEF